MGANSSLVRLNADLEPQWEHVYPSNAVRSQDAMGGHNETVFFAGRASAENGHSGTISAVSKDIEYQTPPSATPTPTAQKTTEANFQTEGGTNGVQTTGQPGFQFGMTAVTIGLGASAAHLMASREQE